LTSINYVAQPNTKPGANPNEVTTGAYGNAFELALNSVTNQDGSVTDTLTYKAYKGDTNGSFSAVSETGSGGNLSDAYSTLFAAMQAHGEMNDQAASQLKTAFSQLETKSQDGAQDATVSGGGMLTQVGGPISFSGISSAQNNTVDSIINELMAQLDGNQTT
jgi:hypothetical protein